MEKILFIGSLNTKKHHYDGERIKTTFTFNILKKYFYINSINLSSFKLLGVVRLIVLLLFFKKKFRYVIISKDRGGAVILHKILHFLKFDMKKVIYFQIGPFLYDVVNNDERIKNLFINDSIITVETISLKQQLNKIGFSNVYVLPNFKIVPMVNIALHDYPKHSLKLVYFSRIEKMKGIYQLIDVLCKLNDNQINFSLDIYGQIMSRKDKQQINYYCRKYDWLNYKGVISLDSAESYRNFQEYDLHVFPTLYGEGIPGAIIDFFIAGVPTFASDFARSKEILTANDSIIYKQGNFDDFYNKLKYIFDHQNILNDLRKGSYKRRNEFDISIAHSFIKEEILKND